MKVSWGKMMMWYFLLSDAFTFAGFIIFYGATRFSVGHEIWPDPNQVFAAFPLMGHTYLPLMFVSLMTFILIMSSVTMVRAVQEGHRMNRNGVLFWLGLTIVGGLAFLGCQAWEWTHMVHIEGHLPWINTAMYYDHHVHAYVAAHPMFSDLFFTITGFHGFHVTTGVIINVTVFTLVAKGSLQRKGNYELVEKVGLYWHFVDLVWVFVFLSFYLL
jgi:cytochrome c oxidase subunit 3